MAGERVLIVEDDRTLLEGLEYSLSKEGYTVSTATDGVEALEIARQERPELIILDIMIPELDGLEVCRILRREGMTMPILMLTAKVEEIDRVVGLEIGADDYITKPFSLRELLARVRAALRGWRCCSRRHQSNHRKGSSLATWRLTCRGIEYRSVVL